MDKESENLVTDAVPDPPRDPKLTSTQNNTETREEINNQDEIPNDRTKNKRHQETKSETKSKKKNSKTKSGIIVNGINIINSSQVRIGTDVHNHFVNSKGGASVFQTAKTWMPKNETDDVEIDFKKVAILLVSTEKLETKHLDLISEHVGSPWELLGIKLGYSRGQLQQFKINYDEFNIKEVIYQMLLEWTQMNPEKATVAYMIDKLLACNLKEIVKIFSEHNFEE